MSQKLSQCSALERSENDPPSNSCQAERPANSDVGRRNKAQSAQRNGETTTSSSPESGSLNGEGKQAGKSRRRRKRSSKPGSRPEAGQADGKTLNEAKPRQAAGQPADSRAELSGLKFECANVWFERSVYERAESLYQRWLASSSSGTTQAAKAPSAPGKNSKGPPSGPASTWVNKASFDHAGCQFVESLAPVPNSLHIPPQPGSSGVARTPDEGYQSLTPTPVQQALVTPTSRQSVNGLPRIPAELLRDVWLEKPLYDRAEAVFYQNLYGNNSAKRSSCAPTSRSNDHPQSLVEEEEEEEEEDQVAVEEKWVVPQGKAEVFHALLPIQEEEEPNEVPEKEEVSRVGVGYFLHPDSEPVWLDKWRFQAAESRFHSVSGTEAAAGQKKKNPRPASSSSTPPRDKTMTSVDFLAQEKVWFDKPRYDEAERCFYERMNGSSQDVGANSILQDIARARENIQKSLAGLKATLCNKGAAHSPPKLHSQLSGSNSADQGELVSRIKSLELENQSLYTVIGDLRAALSKLEGRVEVLEKSPVAAVPASAPAVPYTNGTAVQQKSAPAKKQEEDDDDDFDPFGSDDDEEAEKIKEQRLKEYAEKKAKKPTIIAKSSILLDVKPWDDETDMAKLEECVRSVQTDGLLWGTSKLVPVGYGIKKLQIACVVEDDKVGTDLLEEEITKFEDYVQSVDVAAFNKI
ncbi:eukaryotic translation elongation factor 1 delta b (guanine nucleotide exchange protein) isoform X1 [Takifugu flavidus]|uniref:Elongation factor 1-delta n=1 Tax=Takifugu flavidus TaxID=433684 RepID=A0A5C6MTB3_9TELE|nr:eukaryotic translation elongation factor 1 delta b (guanine nucleotide exchange protein) isoform X1 [Takifugu flavidus]TWW58306.1 Elongation factor 1-delta [Takifugu flavidus]